MNILIKWFDMFLELFHGKAKAKAEPAQTVRPAQEQPPGKDIYANPPSTFPTEEVLARTAWAEARSQGRIGMQAVCNVVQNRAAHPGWWGHDIRSVCLEPYQFSCWNPTDPQAKHIREPIEDSFIGDARDLAALAIAGNLPDITGGADHYYAETIQPPSWVIGRSPTKIFGSSPDRQFYFQLGILG